MTTTGAIMVTPEAMLRGCFDVTSSDGENIVPYLPYRVGDIVKIPGCGIYRLTGRFDLDLYAYEAKLMTNPTAVDTALAPARQKLADAITALIDPRRVTLPTGRHTWLDSTYQQLADAAYEKHSLGGGRSCPASPLWVDAVDCLRDIDHLARQEHPQNPGYTAKDRYSKNRIEHPTVWRLQEIDARKWRPMDVPHINILSTDLERLTLKAERLLTPPTMWFLPNPCPLCNQDHVYVDNSGDQLRRPALQLTVDYCRCGNTDCDGYWPANRFQFLGQLLGYRTPEGVIE